MHPAYLESELSQRALELFAQLQSIIEPTSKWQSSNAISVTALKKVDTGIYVEERGYYDLHRAQLMSDIGFHVSCLMELLPILQTRLKKETRERTPLAQTTKPLSVPGGDISTRAQLPLQDPEIGYTLMEVFPSATPTFRRRLLQTMLQHHHYELPWICSFDDCPEQTRIMTKQEWADHEIRWHRSIIVWVCHMCRRTHDIQEDWKSHLESVHNVRLQGDEAVICGRLSRKIVVKLMDRQVCNFCQEKPLRFDSSWEAFVEHVSSHMDAFTKENEEAFVEHVSSHMDAFAKKRQRQFYEDPRQQAESYPSATSASSKKSSFPEQQIKSGAASMNERQVGKVKWFDDAKGVGFIKPDFGKDLFVHFMAIRTYGLERLKEGQRVSFVIVQGQKGEQADDVRILDYGIQHPKH